MKLDIHVRELGVGLHEATCGALPGCRAVGTTVAEARERLLDAAVGYLAAVSDFVPEDIQHQARGWGATADEYAVAIA